jgi:hypothetical protein
MAGWYADMIKAGRWKVVDMCRAADRDAGMSREFDFEMEGLIRGMLASEEALETLPPRAGEDRDSYLARLNEAMPHHVFRRSDEERLFRSGFKAHREVLARA